ncbi:Fatty acid synthase subunit alpha [Mycena venus]|uniref:Fatty acid synthase subunit alpha n=1 Tax=Mycena venus TaxID=2733690 RepID=A0A8H7CUN3_9AGAR|nr:Fatty acid synthase subunit alpha [Mycena venus]
MDVALLEVVNSIATSTGTLLEIVDYNVEGQQYVCAGELIPLRTMMNVLNYLKVQKIDIAKLTETFTVEKVKEMLSDIVTECHTRATEQQKVEGYIKLERGFATIPLPGIDVPFHSRYLWAGVMPFRAYLSKKINVANLNPDMLIGKYIPNLIAIPFAVTKEYAQIIYDQTSSPRLDKVLKKWDQERWASDPSPTLTGIVTRMLKANLATAAAAPAPVAATAPSGPSVTNEDVPIKAIDILSIIVAQKLKKRVDEVLLSKSIKDLVGGKSTLQNEILGNLQIEFSEKGEELPLGELGGTLASGFGGTLGKYTTGMVSRVVSRCWRQDAG